MVILEFIPIFFYLTTCVIQTTSSSFEPAINFNNSTSFEPAISFKNLTSRKNEPKIIGGSPATFEGTKHLVSIRWKQAEKANGFGYGHMCGGSIIGPSTILTAAHCFLDLDKKDGSMQKDSEFTVVMGTLNKFKKSKGFLEFKVNRVHTHKQFNIDTFQNDIATIIIDGSIPQNEENIQIIPLSNTEIITGQKCRVDGWGVLEYRDPKEVQKLPDVLMTAEISIIDPIVCKSSYTTQILEGMFCAGKWSGGVDSCAGDSGGPLSCNGSLVGIVSWGNRCGLKAFPGIYTSVYDYSDWISENSAYRMPVNIKIIITRISLVILSIKIIL